jgi:hypothetical protein
LKGKNDYNKDDASQNGKAKVEPIATFDQFANSQNYGVSLWFRWARSDTTEQQLLYRLTTSPADQLGDF